MTVLDAILWAKQAWDTVSPETIQKCFRKCGFGSDKVGSKEVTEIPHPAHETVQLMDDTEWADFVQFDRNVETTETLDDKVICDEQDDNDDNDDDDAIKLFLFPIKFWNSLITCICVFICYTSTSQL